MPPFKAVERLAVPDHIRDAFKALRSAEMGKNLSSYGRTSASIAGRVAKNSAATDKFAKATTDAASHFGDDVGKMTTHYKRWTRWNGAAMNISEVILDPEAVNTSMNAVKSAMRSKPVRKAYGGRNPSSGGS